jgi:hypothetical protein
MFQGIRDFQLDFCSTKIIFRPKSTNGRGLLVMFLKLTSPPLLDMLSREEGRGTQENWNIHVNKWGGWGLQLTGWTSHWREGGAWVGKTWERAARSGTSGFYIFSVIAQIFNFLSCPSPHPVGDIGFAKTQLMSIGLQKPYAKTKIGKSCTCMMFIDSADDCC